jgi:hypothetical protein
MAGNDDNRPRHGGTTTGRERSFGFGPFVTRVNHALEDGRELVATSRRARKGLAPLVVAGGEPFRERITGALEWRALPTRIGWWVALLFSIGSLCFVVGGFASTWPRFMSAALASSTVVSWVFFVGSLFFTSAAYLQVVEAANADMTATVPGRHVRSWFGWRPHNLGWLASVVQLAGTILFNFNTADAMIPALGWREADIVVWTPDIVGCLCFIAASALAWAEFSHGLWSFAPRNVSWWIVLINGVGSVAFLASAMCAYVGPGGPGREQVWLDGFFTFVGAVCFLAGSLLLFPELSDE